MIENEEEARAFLIRAREEALARGIREAAGKGTGLYFAEVSVRVPQTKTGGPELKTTFAFACVNSTDRMEVHPGSIFLTADRVKSALQRLEQHEARKRSN